jgi:hypothetical protein
MHGRADDPTNVTATACLNAQSREAIGAGLGPVAGFAFARRIMLLSLQNCLIGYPRLRGLAAGRRT